VRCANGAGEFPSELYSSVGREWGKRAKVGSSGGSDSEVSHRIASDKKVIESIDGRIKEEGGLIACKR